MGEQRWLGYGGWEVKSAPVRDGLVPSWLHLQPGLPAILGNGLSLIFWGRCRQTATSEKNLLAGLHFIQLRFDRIESLDCCLCDLFVGLQAVSPHHQREVDVTTVLPDVQLPALH